IAEMQSVGDAGIDAGRRGTRVEAGREAVGQSEIDAIRAKCAFLGDTVAARIFALDLVLHYSRAVGEVRSLDLEPRLIGAGDIAIGAADADVIVDGDDAVGTPARRGRRAHMHAWRIVAVLTADGHEGATDLRIASSLDVEHLAPLHRWRGGVGMPASR